MVKELVAKMSNISGLVDIVSLACSYQLTKKMPQSFDRSILSSTGSHFVANIEGQNIKGLARNQQHFLSEIAIMQPFCHGLYAVEWSDVTLYDH